VRTGHPWGPADNRPASGRVDRTRDDSRRS
jgi:hypothetical protein